MRNVAGLGAVVGGADLGEDADEAKGRDCAFKAWEEDEEFLAREKIAEWLGGLYVADFLSFFIPLFAVLSVSSTTRLLCSFWFSFFDWR